jgi:hypothetical protein
MDRSSTARHQPESNVTPDAPQKPGLLGKSFSLGTAILVAFALQCVALQVLALCGVLPPIRDYLVAHPDHPLTSLVDWAAELNVLFFPLDLIAGAIGVFAGIRRLIAARARPEEFRGTWPGLRLFLGLLILGLPFTTLLCWASGFRQ